MNLVPDPLHPAVVHFPIVLLLLGAPAAAVAVFWRKHHVPVLAAALLVFGALGTWGAVESGESDGGLVENTSPQLNELVDAHELWAKRTLGISILAAFAAGGSVLAARWPRIARSVAIVAALASVAAAYGIYETGHRGGALVYRHGTGVELATIAKSAALEAPKQRTISRDDD
ncbi:MAG TPA: DUF2231 domain-containing protein [Verrucomicrobiae bacterium]|nr:DUF2231 domain-containing protein [Verrucomicrobiae bacterium]